MKNRNDSKKTNNKKVKLMLTLGIYKRAGTKKTLIAGSAFETSIISLPMAKT